MNQDTSSIVPGFTILDGWAHDFSVEDTCGMTGATPDAVRAAYLAADASYYAQGVSPSAETLNDTDWSRL